VTKPRPAEFKWRQFEPQVILMAVGWYLRFSLSYRDVEELVRERGLSVDHVTVWRWVQRYAPEIERRLRPHLKPTNKSWRVDETYIRVKGKWTYLYRAVDSTGASIDFLLSARRDAAAAKRFFQKALSSPNHPTPRVINVDKNNCATRNDKVSARISELQTVVSERVIAAEVRRRSWCVQVLQERINSLLALIEDRAAKYSTDEEAGPGAATACVVKDCGGKDATSVVWKFVVAVEAARLGMSSYSHRERAIAPVWR
jgi:transposase-like protein